MRFVTWLLSNAVALLVAIWLLPGISLGDSSSRWYEKIVPLIIVALVLGIVSFFVKPVLKLLSLPFILITLGLFLLIINAAMLGLTAWILGFTSIGFHVDGFWAAVLGGIIIAIVGWLVHRVMPDGDDNDD
ncbi:MAG: phage holin family protein [Nocardioides sp.]|nr:phage holin family protein [Nocardioides sp.]